VERGQPVAVEQLARTRMVGVVGAGATPALPDLGARLLQNGFVCGVFPQNEVFDDAEQALTLDVGGAVLQRRLRAGFGHRNLFAPGGRRELRRAAGFRRAQERIDVAGRIIDHLREDHRSRRSDRTLCPPLVKRSRIPCWRLPLAA
jgi:hypothetical protein